MKCPKCQVENRPEARFCKKCRTELELRCPSCDAACDPDSAFCDHCGHDLAAPAEAPPVDLSFEEKLEKIQRYLPDGLTEKILAQRGKIEGERKQVTVMFCDAEGFSQISEKLGPEKVYSVIDEVFEILIHKVHEYGGTVNKMTGDGIMALFGAPIALEDAPQRAIRSALAIQRDISRLSDRKKEETGMPSIRIRVGIHTGPVVVGSLGNDLRVEFTAVGDTVNLASRMEGLAEPGTVYVTEDTFKLTEGLFRFEALGEVHIKGKETPVKAYRVIAPSTRRTRFDVSAERGLTPFLGRERELELLLDGLDRARSGRGQAFSVMGEAGVGKSRLLYEFRKALGSQDVTFLEGRCLSYSTNVAYHPVIDLLQSTFDIQEGDGDNRIREKVKRGLKEMGTDEASTLPFILELMSVKDSGIDPLGLSPEARKDRTLEALRRIVLKGSEMRPLVLAIEDLHWVDRSSEDTLKSLLDAISGAQVLLIFTYRPEFVHTWGTKSYHSQVNLMRLSNRETLAMAAYILGTEVIGSDLEELILEKTEGIPFFIEEFIKSLKDLEMIEWRDSGYYLAKDIKEVAIPSTIQDVIMARVDALPEGAKDVLQTGSAIGREFSCELIKRVTGVPQPEITTHLSALRDSELLYERGIFPQATYIFRHSLTQEVAYDSLLEKRKREIHERIGQAIEELFVDRLEEFYEVLAHHYSLSVNHEKASHYLKLSGDKAFRTPAHGDAYRFYNEAVKLLNEMPQTTECRRRGIEIRLNASLAMITIGYPEGSLQMLEEGVSLSRELGDDKSLGLFYGHIAVCYTLTGDPVMGKKYAEGAFEAAMKTEDIDLIAQTAHSLCAACSTLGEFSRIIETVPKVLHLMEEARAEPTLELGFSLRSMLLTHYARALGEFGNFEEAKASFKEALSLVRDTDDRSSLIFPKLWYGYTYNLEGDIRRAITHLEEGVKLCEEGYVPALESWFRSFLCWSYCLLDDLETARNHAEVALEIESGTMPRPYAPWAMGMVCFHLGDLVKSQYWMGEALKVAQKYSRTHEGCPLIYLGKILCKADPDESRESEEYILQGIKRFDESKRRPWRSIGYLFLGELYADTGQNKKAIEALKKAEGEFQEMGMDYWLRRTQEVLQRVKG
ncbi:MAG: AAA family ATPase [Dehalococcoidia bacterium]|nr:MAG: AAA family ATPase [Dehalococcoidia bacterium]